MKVKKIFILGMLSFLACPIHARYDEALNSDLKLRQNQRIAQQAAAAQQEAEAEQRLAAAEQRRAEAEQRRAEAEQRRAEAEQRRAEAEQRRADLARRLAEAEQRQADVARRLAEAEQQRAEAEKQRAGVLPVLTLPMLEELAVLTWQMLQESPTDAYRVDLGWNLLVKPGWHVPAPQQRIFREEHEVRRPFPFERMRNFTIAEIREFLETPPVPVDRAGNVTPPPANSAAAHFRDTTWPQMQEALRYAGIIPPN